MSQAVTKVCRFCETDVSGLPRIKDKKGRYACQPCFERLKEKRRAEATAAPAPSAAFDPDVDTESIAIALEAPAAAAPGRPCPSCKAMMGAGDVFCIHCGTNAQTGGRAGKVKVKKAKPSKAKKSRRGGNADDCGPASAAFSVLFVVAVGLGLLLSRPLGLPPVVLSLSLMLFIGYIGAIGILTLVAALRQDGFVQFLLVWFVPFYALYWVYGRAESSLLKLNFTLAILLYAGVLLGALALGPAA